MKTNEQIIKEIETEINPTGSTGLLIGTLFARLKYAERVAESALLRLKDLNESVGNDIVAELTKTNLEKFRSTMGN